MKTIAFLTLAVVLVGCSQKGGSSDDYGTESGRRSQTNLAPQSIPNATDTQQTNQSTQPVQPYSAPEK